MLSIGGEGVDNIADDTGNRRERKIPLTQHQNIKTSTVKTSEYTEIDIVRRAVMLLAQSVELKPLSKLNH